MSAQHRDCGIHVSLMFRERKVIEAVLDGRVGNPQLGRESYG